MSQRRVPILTFLRDLALSLPAFYERRQRVIMNGDFVPVPGDALRRSALTPSHGGSASVTSLADFVRRTRARRGLRANVDKHRPPRRRVVEDTPPDADHFEA